jgi:hypothetical protein
VTDKVVNLMEGVQNLRKAVYEWVPSAHILIVQQLTVSFKVKVDAAEPGSSKHATLSHQAVNYLYRCEPPFRLVSGAGRDLGHRLIVQTVR